MPSSKTTDQTKAYMTAGLFALPFGLLTSVVGTFVLQPFNARLTLLGYLVTLASLLLIFTSFRTTKKTAKPSKKK